MSENKIYTAFAADQALPIHFQPWWLDATSDAPWDVCLATNPEGGIEGALVYSMRKKFGIRIIDMPFMTAYSGPWINYPVNMQKRHAFYGFQKRVLTELYGQLPPCDYFYQRWHPEMQNWLPLKWLGYQQSTLYTYLLTLDDLDAVFSGLNKRLRRYIQKAEEILTVTEDEDIDVLLELMRMSFDVKSDENPYHPDKLKRLDNALRTHRARHLYVAKDHKGEPCAALYCTHDTRSAYFLTAGSNPALRSNGAVPFLHWHAIRAMQKIVPKVDFEGSVYPEVEQFIRAFGGHLTPHYKINRARNLVLKVLSILRRTEYYP